MGETIRQGRILVMDDDESWRYALTVILQRSGFYVDMASTVEQAKFLLRENFYHLLVLDLRMDETDQSNEDGIQMLEELERQGLSDAIKVIMLSAYGTKEQIRTAFKDYKVVDFPSKDQFDDRIFVEDVRRIFTHEIKVNLQLDINWQTPYKPERAIRNILVTGKRIKDATPFQQRILDEFVDLLCKLFYQAESILVQELTHGKSGASVLLVTPFYPLTGAGHAVVVKFGDVSKINEEYNNFREHVEAFVGGGRNTTVINIRHTPHLGGISYALLGIPGEELTDFGTFYEQADIGQIKEALERLFMKTCNVWYTNLGHRHLRNLTEDYQQLLGFTDERLRIALERLKVVVQGETRLYFNALEGNRLFLNPVTIAEVKLVEPTYVCITHGDFNQQNILVDSTENMWMIDFQKTGRGHYLRDVAALDTIIRIQLLRAEEATLNERLLMEAALCSINSFDQIEQLMSAFGTDNKALSKVYTLIIHLRMIARRLAPSSRGDLRGYYIALFYNALNMIRFYSLTVQQREHALLSASLLADRLELQD